jgi:hypothetical protein
MRSATASDYPANAIPFLKGVEKGYDVDIRTPLFEGRDREEVANEWANILYSEPQRMVDELVEIEKAQERKIGPVSRRKPFADRISDIEPYYSPRRAPEIELSEINELLLRKSEHIFTPNERMRPISHAKAAAQLPNNTNSGLPLFKKRGTVLEQSIALAMSGKVFPAMLGWRGSSGQTGDYYPKQRVVWMIPFSQNICEARFQVPFHTKLLQYPQYFAAQISMEQVDVEVTYMLDNLPDQAYMMATDYANFDQTIRSQLSWFIDRLKGQFQTSSHADIENLLTYAQNCELLCTEEVVFTGFHGLASGLNITNASECVINRDTQMSSPVALSGAFQVQGDDSAGRVWDPEKHLQHLERCGFDFNKDKQYVSRKAVVYLQRLHHTDYRIDGISRGQYPTMRALNSLLGMERFHADWDKDMEALRTLAILENCKWHPSFSDFVSFVVKRGDKYLKEFVTKLADGKIARKSVIRKAMSIPGFVPTYNQNDSIGGIMEFSSFLHVLNI